MASSRQAPQPRLSDPIAGLRIPVQHLDLAEPEATEPAAPEPVKESVDLEALKGEVVVASSAPTPPVVVVRVKKTARVSWGSTMLLLTEGQTLRADHYEDGAFDRMRSLGVELENVG